MKLQGFMFVVIGGYGVVLVRGRGIAGGGGALLSPAERIGWISPAGIENKRGRAVKWGYQL